jgi:hypothetical protein
MRRRMASICTCACACSLTWQLLTVKRTNIRTHSSLLTAHKVAHQVSLTQVRKKRDEKEVKAQAFVRAVATPATTAAAAAAAAAAVPAAAAALNWRTVRLSSGRPAAAAAVPAAAAALNWRTFRLSSGRPAATAAAVSASSELEEELGEIDEVAAAVVEL